MKVVITSKRGNYLHVLKMTNQKSKYLKIEDIFIGIILFLSLYVYIHLKFKCYKNI